MRSVIISALFLAVCSCQTTDTAQSEEDPRHISISDSITRKAWADVYDTDTIEQNQPTVRSLPTLKYLANLKAPYFKTQALSVDDVLLQINTLLKARHGRSLEFVYRDSRGESKTIPTAYAPIYLKLPQTTFLAHLLVLAELQGLSFDIETDRIVFRSTVG